jgi:hypothetical protein
MGEIGTAQEWRRLQELYRKMSEEQLHRVAEQGYQLTDIAKQVLHAEIAHRNVKVIVRLAPPNEEEELQQEVDSENGFDPQTLDLTGAGCTVENHEEAEWVKRTLNQAGIPCYFGDDRVENVNRLEFGPERGFYVSVLTSDGPRAKSLLKDFNTRFGKVEENISDFAGHCPKCRSTDIVFEGLDSETPEGPAPDGKVRYGPGPGNKFHWSCAACDHRWEDDGFESET